MGLLSLLYSLGFFRQLTWHDLSACLSSEVFLRGYYKALHSLRTLQGFSGAA